MRLFSHNHRIDSRSSLSVTRGSSTSLMSTLAAVGLFASLSVSDEAQAALPERAERGPVLSLDAGIAAPRLELSTRYDLHARRADGQADAQGGIAVSEQSSVLELEAAAMYRMALFQMSQGNFVAAQNLFEQVQKQYPGTQAAAAAPRQLELLKLGTPTAPTGVATPMTAPKEPGGTKAAATVASENSGRAEFVVLQTLAGGVFMGALPFAANMDGLDNVYILFPMLGLAGGLGASLAYSAADPMNSKEALAWWSTQALVTGNAVALYNAWYETQQVEYVYDGEYSYPQYVEYNPAVPIMLGLGAGTALGYLSSHYLPMTEGQVSMAFSAGIWAPIVTNLSLVTLLDDNLDGVAYQLAAVIASNAAALTVGKLAIDHNFPISRSRMRLVNLGGFVGGFFGAGLAFLGSAEDVRVYTGLAVVGALGGLGGAFALTQEWDKTYHPELFAGANTNAVVALKDGKLGLGSPVPSLSFIRTDEQQGDTKTSRMQPYVSVNLAGGTW